jgi:hypothetical protein
MPTYYDLACVICGLKQSSDQLMLPFYLNRPCPECGGPVRIVRTETEKID